MLIALLLLLAAVAGAICVWLFIRTAPSAATAPAPDAPVPEIPAPPPPPAPAPLAAVPVLQPAAPLPEEAPAGAADSIGLESRQIFGRLYQLALGPLVMEVPPGQELQVLLDDAAQSFGALATDPRYAMRRPMLLPQLLRAVNDRNSNNSQLVKIIARDPALAGSLLKVANSPAYRVREKPVESLERAVALLGSDGLHSLIAIALVQPIFKRTEAGFPRFPQVIWEHTFKAAIAAEAFAGGVDENERFAAQLLALTMGLGSIVTFRITIDRCQTLMGGKLPHPATIVGLLESQLATVAGKVAASWDLSERVLAALQEQQPAHPEERPPQPSLLGGSLVSGRCLAALALLREADAIEDEVVIPSMLKLGSLPAGFEPLWARLTEKERAHG